MLVKFSKSLQVRLDEYLTPIQSKLVAGILLGTRENVPIVLYNNLINTGTIHIIAASGYNVSVIAGFAMIIFSKFLKRRLSILLSVMSIVSFVVISGGGEAVTRAAIMGIIAFTAQSVGRVYSSLYALALTSVLMLIFKPSLVGSISFQLSVSSTLGILIISPRVLSFLSMLLSQVKMKFMKGEFFNSLAKIFIVDLSTTFAATIVTLPIVMIHYDRVSLVSILVNLLVLWVVPPIMLLGFLLLTISLLSSTLGRVVVLLIWPLLHYFTQVISWFGQLKYASIEIKNFNVFMLLGYYSLLIFMISIKVNKRPTDGTNS